MRKFLSALGAGTFLFASAALAVPTCTSVAGQPATDCTAGPFTFSNFSANSFDVSNAALFLGGVTSNSNSVSSTQPITGISTANGGNPAMGSVPPSSVATWVCAGGNAGPGGCGADASSKLAYVQANGGQTAPASLNGSGNTALSAFQNIHVPTGGTLGNFTQTFSFGGGSAGAAGGSSPSNSDAPEPMSLALIGSGLLALGVLRRKHA